MMAARMGTNGKGREEDKARGRRNPRYGLYPRVVKRLLDLMLGIVALPLVAVVFAVIAVLIRREDGGPVFYNAERVGRGGRPFVMYKFRTMHVGAPDLKEPDGSTYSSASDPRQTRVGARLRLLSLDELPQVLNVLKGDMSFIGPRPDLANEVELYEGDEHLKLLVKPGLSGYAQVHGRNAIPWRSRLALDVEYVRRQGFLLDASIFFKTFLTVFSQKDVYESDATAPSTPGDKPHDQLDDGSV
ncbi:MAG: sugar transferase [Coriobacteriales bacterium]|jgi:lipopolysaccharide/colanic/teichoic acid biosynthesis glycosyltransferase|nr:sugar transferase [Coriobacteriales bacterium]